MFSALGKKKRTPFRVIDEHFGGGHKGRGIWGHYFCISHSLACRFFAIATVLMLAIQKVLLVSLACALTPSITSVRNRLILEIVKMELEPWRRVPSSSYNIMSYRAGDLRDVYDDSEIQKSLEEREGPLWSDSMSSKQPKVPCFVPNSLPRCAQPSWLLVLLGDIRSAVWLMFLALATRLVRVLTHQGSLSDLRVPSLRTHVLLEARDNLSACALNLGNWERSRKRSNGTWEEHKPDPTCGNLFLHFLSNISSHILIVQEASTIRHQEKGVKEEHGWLTATSPDKTLLCGIHANPWPGAYIRDIAGTCAVNRYKETPLAYAIFEACFGDEPRREDWERAG